MARLALIGAGQMGETVLAGLLAAGWSATDIVIAEASPEREAEVVARRGVTAAGPAEAAAQAPIVLVVVKPHHVAGLLADIAGHLTDDALIVSLAAGITTAALEAALPQGTPVVRVMPNTPAQVGQGMYALSAGSAATDDHLAQVEQILAATGRVVIVPESQQDAVTALSGSGPAYVFLIAEAMIEAGVAQGLTRATATELTVQTLFGSATLLRETGGHPALLRERVTSPGGTTAAGLRELERHGVRTALAEAIAAAHDRSVELGAQ